ncbi:imidazole glycerol phosphate synthase subunit HisH [Selenomonadales bacterium OttesenSCG-928-I06]|nr:imidazole glycerol phosphate synthase subunit HisH [Selenomonadales bacterium OttesenSCG-928-I06]
MSTSSNNIVIIDYGMGNLRSVKNAFLKINKLHKEYTAKITISRDIDVIKNATKVVLPGVGAFGDCMRNLQNYGLVDVIKETIASGKPFLGICVGLQLLFEKSEEDLNINGLGIFQGTVCKIKAPDLKIPHMGWNDLTIADKKSYLFDNIPKNPYVYFVHTYHAKPKDKSIISSTTTYGETVTGSISYKNIQAVQFHPEKSGDLGLNILVNFQKGGLNL